MRRFVSGAFAVAVAVTSGCSTDDPPTRMPLAPLATEGLGELTAKVMGGGSAALSVGPMDVAVKAKRHIDGTAKGTFSHFIITSTGTIDVTAEVTCVTTDVAAGRAWVGGRVLTNNSTRPDFMTSIHEPGDEVWFRVADNGEGSDAPADRSTSPGFEGALGFITSAEYCATMPWPNEPPALVSGNIQVHD
jgi:hypothetical protein